MTELLGRIVDDHTPVQATGQVQLMAAHIGGGDAVRLLAQLAAQGVEPCGHTVGVGLAVFAPVDVQLHRAVFVAIDVELAAFAAGQ